jgi:hypothetical protein
MQTPIGNESSLNGLTAERAESYLREYNDYYVLPNINIHEADSATIISL